MIDTPGSLPPLPTSEEDMDAYAQQLTTFPENYATICDHYREMSRRFAESRDALKHEGRALKNRVDELSTEVARLTQARDFQQARAEKWVAVAERQGAALAEATDRLAELTQARDTLQHERDEAVVTIATLVQLAHDYGWNGVENSKFLTVFLAEKLRAGADAGPLPAWQPIETCPRDTEVIFWLVPKTAEESYTDTSGHPIMSNHAPYWKRGRWLSWGALSKPTHWMPLPSAPTDAR